MLGKCCMTELYPQLLNSFFLQVCIYLFQHHLLKKTCSFSIAVLCSFVSESIFIWVYIYVSLYFWAVFVPSIHLPFPLPMPYCLHYSSLKICFYMIMLDFLLCFSSSLFPWLVWVFWLSLYTQFVSVHKITGWDLNWDCVEFLYQVRKKWYLVNIESS